MQKHPCGSLDPDCSVADLTGPLLAKRCSALSRVGPFCVQGSRCCHPGCTVLQLHRISPSSICTDSPCAATGYSTFVLLIIGAFAASTITLVGPTLIIPACKPGVAMVNPTASPASQPFQTSPAEAQQTMCACTWGGTALL